MRQRPAKPCTRVRFPSPPPAFDPGAISSAGERFPDTEEVTGSIPVSRTRSDLRKRHFCTVFKTFPRHSSQPRRLWWTHVVCARHSGTDDDNLLRTGHGATVAKTGQPRGCSWSPSGAVRAHQEWGACCLFWPPSSPLRMPRVPCTPGGGLLAGGRASGVSCQGWQPDVLNALSVGSICTT